MALKIIDRAIQVHGGGGVSDDFPLAMMYAHLRTLRLADGPDEVHKLHDRPPGAAQARRRGDRRQRRGRRLARRHGASAAPDRAEDASG